MSYFLDTSALVKVYHAEPGWEVMDRIYVGGESIGVAILTLLEFRSAMTRRLRTGTIEGDTFEVAMEQFAKDVEGRYEVFSFSDRIVEDAIKILDKTGLQMQLRSLDALQFAFYQAHGAPDSIFVSADIRFLEVVKACGYPTLNPGDTTL